MDEVVDYLAYEGGWGGAGMLIILAIFVFGAGASMPSQKLIGLGVCIFLLGAIVATRLLVI